MIRLGLIGQPIAASLSPALHAEAARLCGLAVHYALYPTEVGAVADTLGALERAGLRGFNVTAPHKARVAELVDTMSPAAARLGVVNTVVFEGGRRLGHNTDLAGVRWALGPVDQARCVVIGAGGAARAVVAALADGGARQVRILARRPAQAEGLCPLADGRGEAHPLQTLATQLADADVVVSCLPARAASVVAQAPLARCAPGAQFMDLGYGASAQGLVQGARAAGMRAQDGLGMLAAQGVAAFARWTDHTPDVAAVLAHLRRVQRARTVNSPA